MIEFLKRRQSTLFQSGLLFLCGLVAVGTLVQLFYSVTERNPTFTIEANVVTEFPVCPGEYIEVVVQAKTQNTIAPILVVSTIYQENLVQIATSSNYYASPQSLQNEFTVNHKLYVPMNMERGAYLYSVAVNEVGRIESQGFTIRFRIEDDCDDR